MSAQALPPSFCFPSKRFNRPQAALSACLLFLLLFVSCRPVATPEIDTRIFAQPDPGFNQLFQRTDGGWTGGDGTLSVALPDSRTLWLFGDSFLGKVSPDGRRQLDTPFIRNSMMVQKDGVLQTLFQRTDGTPTAFFNPVSPDQWFWPGHGVVEDGRVKIFLHRFEQTEPRLWAWRWIGNAMAELSLPSLTLTGIAPAPSNNEVMYGVCVLETEAHTYIYGTLDQRKEAHLARAPVGQVQGQWQYFTGDSWSDAPAATRPILNTVSTQFAAIRNDSGVYLFSMDGRVAYSSEIVVYRASQPWGPWQGPLIIYRAPEATEVVAAYNPFVHPQFTDNHHILVSYNLNHITDPSALYRDADIYRPRFIRVDMEKVAQHFGFAAN